MNDADLLRLGHDLVLWHDLILDVRGHSCLMHHTLLLICESSLSHFLDLTRWWLVSLRVLWEVRTFLHEWCLSYSARGESYFSEVRSLSKNWGIFTSWWDIATSLIGSGHQSVTDSGAITLREKKLVVWRWSLQSFKVKRTISIYHWFSSRRFSLSLCDWYHHRGGHRLVAAYASFQKLGMLNRVCSSLLLCVECTMCIDCIYLWLPKAFNRLSRSLNPRVEQRRIVIDWHCHMLTWRILLNIAWLF